MKASHYSATMPQLPELYTRIDAGKASLDALRPLDREREDRVMQKFRLWWTYHSNAIEGNKLSQGETEIFLMEGLTAKGKPLKDHLDLKGHSDAINFLLEFIRNEGILTEAVIREFHRILLGESYRVEALTPDGKPTTKLVSIGQYKTSPNHVRTPTGEIHYYATPEETPSKMHDLMDWYRQEMEKGEMHPVEIAARFHHRFTGIHPFDDGNGRMSRLLMNLMLMQLGYPPTVIRLSERDAYLGALRRADRDEHDDFLAFIGGHVLDALNLFILGAQGKEVSEPTDLRKEIALELLRLKHIEEPLARSPELLLALYQGSFYTLITEAANQLSPFCEFFTDNTVAIQSTVQIGNTQTSVGDSKPLAQVDIAAHIRACFASGSIPTASNISFRFSGFRKARFDTFDVGSTLNITCEPLKYTINAQTNLANPPIIHFYQEPLSRDEITPFVEKMARFFLKTIQEKTKTS